MSDSISKFEGPEKKLEIIMAAPSPGLRHNREGKWHRVVDASRASVLSRISNEDLDAYLLSESSLFVWEDRMLMITCGKTTLVEAVPEILDIVDRDRVAHVFYERKSFMFPNEQPADFEDDVARLTPYFPGKSYRLGPANDDHVHVFYSSGKDAAPSPDVTLQILMHDLDPMVMDIFVSTDATPAYLLEKRSGLSALFPGMQKDSHLFFPYGYSLNGIFEKSYVTVHVTPQPEGSYVSFETNVIQTDYSALIDQVLSIFKPNRFTLVLTTSMDSTCRQLHRSIGSPISGYDVFDKSLYEFNSGYSVTFLNYINHSGPD